MNRLLCFPLLHLQFIIMICSLNWSLFFSLMFVYSYVRLFTLWQSRGCRGAWEELADWLTATYPWRCHAKSQPRNHDLPLLRLKPEDVGFAGVSSTSLDSDHVTQRSQLPPGIDQYADDALVRFFAYYSGFLLCNILPFDARCYHMGTAIKHPVPDRVKPSFVIFDTRALWRIRSGTGCFIAVPMTEVSVKGWSKLITCLI